MSQIIHTPPPSDDSSNEELVIDATKPTKPLPRSVTVFPLSNFVAFPHMILPVVVPKGKLQDQLHSSEGKKMEYIGFIARKKGKGEDPSPSELFDVGVMARILRVIRLPEGSSSMIVQTIQRFKVKQFTKSVPTIIANVEYLEDFIEDDKRVHALAASAQKLLHEVIQLSPTISEEFSLAALNIEGPKKLSDFIASHLKRIDLTTRQQLLEILNVDERLERGLFHLSQELEILRLGNKIQGEIQDKISTSQKEYFLKEQLKAIRRELGEDKDDFSQDIHKIEEKLAEVGLSQEAQEKVDEEMRRLKMIPAESTEYSILRNYLELVASLPWSATSEEYTNLNKAKRILDRDHHGLKDVKERIIEFLAVKKLKKELSGSIICFVGPPGVGKTSLGKSVAEALGRKFFRLSLGGMRDEAEIKGHRRTYVGSMPGRLIQALKRCETKNPVILLDELDKIGSDWRGDPASALLEVLDPEQNKSFLDHYLDVPFDLSRVLFICTANTTSTIPVALKDRLEIIDIAGYIESEKLSIAQKYLFPKQLEKNGLKKSQISITKAALLEVVRSYTRESGVRQLEREIGKICRKVATKVAKGSKQKSKVDVKDLQKLLGVEKYTKDSSLPRKPGVVMGLAWTSVGGEVLFIESNQMKGSRSLTLTGKLGDTMNESAKIALSYVRSIEKKLKLDLKDFGNTDIHIHFPAGAIPKDGPSAGITIATSLVSLFSGVPVKAGVAMTGELSLTGQVLPVGGLREKLIAARQFKAKEVIVPFENKKDIQEVPSEVKKGIKIIYAKNFEDVYRAAFPKTRRK